MSKKEMNPLKGEFIGKEIDICGAKNPSLIGLKGMIIDETKNTLTIKTAEGEKKLLKSQVKIHFIKDKKTIEGEKIQKRPEERIKKL